MDDAHRHEKIAPRRTAARTVPPGKAAGCAGRIPARHDNARRAGAPLQPDGAAAQRQRDRQSVGPVRCKQAGGYGVSRKKYEFDDLARIARETGLSLPELLEKLP